MNEFLIFFKVGLQHVLDWSSYDHLLFLIALVVPFTFKEWPRLLLLVSMFTLGHTLALVLSVFNIISTKESLVEFLIPVTIMLTALYGIFTAGKTGKRNGPSMAIMVTAFFGIIHGLAFANYFKSLLPGNPTDKVLPLLDFAVGIEAAQILIVVGVLILAYICQNFFRFSKRDWVLVMCGFVAGVSLTMIMGSAIWK